MEALGRRHSESGEEQCELWEAAGKGAPGGDSQGRDVAWELVSWEERQQGQARGVWAMNPFDFFFFFICYTAAIYRRLTVF